MQNECPVIIWDNERYRSYDQISYLIHIISLQELLAPPHCTNLMLITTFKDMYISVWFPSGGELGMGQRPFPGDYS